MTRKFFYVCAGMLMLALSYHFGAGTAVAQAPSNPIVTLYGGAVVTANGDVLASDDEGHSWHYAGNVFASAHTPSNPIVAFNSGMLVTENGDAYFRTVAGGA